MQRNSGNKAAKRGNDSGAGAKNRREIDKLFGSIRSKKNNGDEIELNEGNHIGRVTRKFGNGRVEVFYVKKEVTETVTSDGEIHTEESYPSFEKQAIIRGSFRGRGKRDVWIDINSIVLVEENLGVLEIVGVLTRDQLRDISTKIYVDPRILNENGVSGETETGGIEFEEVEQKPLDIDNI